MSRLLQRIRKHYLCWKYLICPKHLELLRGAAFADRHCETCRQERQERVDEYDAGRFLVRRRLLIQERIERTTAGAREMLEGK